MVGPVGIASAGIASETDGTATMAPLPGAVSHVYLDARGGGVSLSWHEPPADALPEVVVQRLWAERRWRGPLRTVDGRALVVLDTGRPNVDGGPDFRGARLRIGDETVVGDVEVHVASALWRAHGHARDPKYDAVALHVTLHADATTGALVRRDGTILPELVLAPVLDGRLGAHVATVLAPPPRAAAPTAPADLPCAWGWPAVSDAALAADLADLAADRLARRARRLALDAGPSPGALDDALYRRVARVLGYRPNADAFERLAARVPLGALHALPDATDRTAVLLGVAGLLPSPADALADEAARVAADLRQRFAPRACLAPGLDARAWQRSRLRPAATPELRLAQLAALTGAAGLLRPDAARHLAQRVAGAADAPADALRRLVAACRAVPEGEFWHRHYHFARPAAWHGAALGAATVGRMLANAVLPAALAAGAALPDVLAVLRALPPDADAIADAYVLPRAVRRSALVTQGLHEWAETRCAPRRCLDCPTGRRLLDGAP